MFDINAAIGHWPFRQIPNQTADELRDLLRGHGIDGAAVVHTHALFYRNCHDANLELAEAIAPHSDAFVGVGTINPTYAAWEKDLCQCVGDLGFRGIRLVPQYHGYTLGSDVARAAAQAAASSAVPVFIPHRVVDIRQRHWMDTETVNSLADVCALARAVPAVNIVFTECRVTPAAMTSSSQTDDCTNLYLETSRLSSATDQTLATLVRTLGANRVLFGSGAPFKEITPAVLKIRHAAMEDAEREMVIGGSARALLACPGA